MFSKAVALLLFLTELVAAYANPGACSGDCGVHDPAVIRRVSDGKYYRFSTNNFMRIQLHLEKKVSSIKEENFHTPLGLFGCSNSFKHAINIKKEKENLPTLHAAYFE